MRRCSSASFSRSNSSGERSTDIQSLRAWWEERFRRSREYARQHPEELTEYGRLLHFDFPVLIEQLERAARKLR